MNNLSVIIPTYNRAAFIRPCVESVRANGADIEIIVVDDGSSDDTAERVAEIDGVTLIRQANAGPATARNTGFAHSRRPFVAFLDSDDTWRPGIVGRLVDVLMHHADLELAFADTRIGNDTDGWQSLLDSSLDRVEFEAIPSLPLGPSLRQLERAAFFRRMVRKNQIFLGSAVIRRSAIEAINGFDPDLFGGEDYELVLRLAHRAPVAFLDEPLAHYLKHPVSLSANRDRMDREFVRVMHKLLEKNPDLLPEERECLHRRRRELMYYLAYNAYDRGERTLARERFRDLTREFGATWQVRALLAACRLPGGLLRRLRRIKQASVGGLA